MNPALFDSMRAQPLLGMDEVGTGCIAGPIAVAGAVLPEDSAIVESLLLAGLRDSKKMTAAGRERVYDMLMEHAVFRKVVFMHPEEIALYEQGPALDALFGQVISSFRSVFPSAGEVLIDGNYRPRLEWTHVAIPKADQLSLTVSAASVLAKVERDRLMTELSELYPEYGFDVHKGYPTKVHLDVLEKLGACAIHRKSTKPVKDRLSRA